MPEVRPAGPADEPQSRMTRERAHALYRRHGYATSSHHFLKRLD